MTKEVFYKALTEDLDPGQLAELWELARTQGYRATGKLGQAVRAKAEELGASGVIATLDADEPFVPADEPNAQEG